MSSNVSKPLWFVARKWRNPVCKLSNGQAWFVRETKGHIPARELARHFGVSHTTIFEIRKGSLYRELMIDAEAKAEFKALVHLFRH